MRRRTNYMKMLERGWHEIIIAETVSDWKGLKLA